MNSAVEIFVGIVLDTHCGYLQKGYLVVVYLDLANITLARSCVGSLKGLKLKRGNCRRHSPQHAMSQHWDILHRNIQQVVFFDLVYNVYSLDTVIA